jgi:drug/metabolite transporter (DMT)-like permease
MRRKIGAGQNMFRMGRENGASLALFLAASAWGLYWFPLREMEKVGIHGTWTVAWFNFFPALLLMPYVFWFRHSQWRELRKVLFIGAAAGIGLGLYASSMVFSSVIRATLLFYLTPIWATLIGWLWLGERLTKGRYLAIGGGLFGLWLMLSGAGAASEPLNIGDLCALLAGMLWGLGAAGMKRWPEAPVATTSMMQFLLAVIFCAAAGQWASDNPAPSFQMLRETFPLTFVGSAFVLLPSIFVIFWASRIVYPGRGGILMMSEVMVAILSASILLPEETLSTMQWIGGATILAACVIEVRTSAA